MFDLRKAGTALGTVVLAFSVGATGPAFAAPKAHVRTFRHDAHSATAASSSASVGMARTPAGRGYWIVSGAGAVTHLGDAGSYGSIAGPLAKPVVGITATPDGKGYWLVASDGGIFSFGDAQFYGSMGGHPIDGQMVAMTTTPDGKGYWEVASDGGIFTFGDAQFYGSVGGHPINGSMVGIAATHDGKGYWEVASDGGIFSFGDAQFYGSIGGHGLSGLDGMTATPDGRGYWEVASDGGIFTFGDAGFWGSKGGHPLNDPVVGMAASPDGNGYWLVAADGGIFTFGDAGYYGNATQPSDPATVVVNAASKWVGTTTGQIGRTGENQNLFTRWYYGNTTKAAWCAIFLSYVFHDAGVALPAVQGDQGGSALVADWRPGGALFAQAHFVSLPYRSGTALHPGDVVGRAAHVGIVRTVNGDSFTTIEGNTTGDVVGGGTYRLGDLNWTTISRAASFQ